MNSFISFRQIAGFFSQCRKELFCKGRFSTFMKTKQIFLYNPYKMLNLSDYNMAVFKKESVEYVKGLAT